MMTTKHNNGSHGKQYSKVSQKLFWAIYNLLPNDIKESVYFAELNKEFGKQSSSGSYLYFDFVIVDLKYCIEFQGTYFHCDPRKYQAEYVNKKLNMTAKQIWDRDEEKFQHLRNLGFSVKAIWQSDVTKSSAKELAEHIIQLYDANSTKYRGLH